jgi:hypothetical protein
MEGKGACYRRVDDDGGGGCAAKGVWGDGSAHGGGHACREARVSGGVDDPDVCGLGSKNLCLSIW